MDKKSTLILDCDGVLYPTSMIKLSDFVDAMHKTFAEFEILPEKLETISERTKKQNKLGMFNYIKAVCSAEEISFATFCDKMFAKVNYDQITPDKPLLQDILNTAKQRRVVIFTNNTITHLDHVLQKRFGISVFEMENRGVECYDITSTERNGVFFPKQNPKALELFAAKIEQRPEDCVLVDDTLKNLESAKAAGMQAVLINDDFTLKQYLAQQQNGLIKPQEHWRGIIS